MFTGITVGTAQVTAIHDSEGTVRLTLLMPEAFWSEQPLQNGASVACDGVCLTVVDSDEQQSTVQFDAIAQTCRVTSIGRWQPGTYVNVERSLRYGDEVGGHILSGHVMAVGEILAINTGSDYSVTIEVAPELAPYIFEKGFIAVNGCSLTVSSYSPEGHRFTVHLIPETLQLTNLSRLAVGDVVNLEPESSTVAVVDTVSRLLADGRFTQSRK